MCWKAVLSSFSNQLNHLYHCQIPTCFTARKVFGTKFDPIDLKHGRLKVESDIYATVWQIFEFLNINKITEFLIIMCIKNTTIFVWD